jgi:hypothetical protein
MNAAWSTYLARPDPSEVSAAARRLRAGGPDLLLVLVAEGGAPDLPGIAGAMARDDAPFLGGLFPELLVGGVRHGEGVLLVGLRGIGVPVVIPDFTAAESALEDLTRRVAGFGGPPPTALVLVDGLAPDISRLLEATYGEMGNRVNYWGGGAGSRSFVRQPCLFTRAGVFEGGAVVALSSFRADLGVRHGWKAFKGPLVATRAVGNTLHQLNWEDALSVYGAHVGAGLGERFDAARMSEQSRAYPLGIRRLNKEFVVRDPVSVDSAGAIVCVGDVPENAVLSILRGEPDSLVEAAREAATQAAVSRPEAVRHCLIADCISRVMFLGEGFQAELDAIEEGLGALGDRPPATGVLTLGEISSPGDGYLEFFNKTCVVAVLRDA